MFYQETAPASPAGRSGSDSLSDKTLLLKNAGQALEHSNTKTADFYLARYLGICTQSAETCPPEALSPLLKKRKFEPKAFLPADWDPAFVDWFENSVRERWGVPAERVREKARSFEIAQNIYEDKYFVTVAAYPELEQWYVLKEGVIDRPLLLAMGAYRDRPTLFFGRSLKGSALQSYPTFLGTQKRRLHYLWKPEFFDADANGIPEVWVRFNLSWGNGFVQVLEVYKIQSQGKLLLWQHFQSAPNGFARRLENGSVEVTASDLSLKKTYSLETWSVENKEFKKLDQKEVSIQEWPPVVSRT